MSGKQTTTVLYNDCTTNHLSCPSSFTAQVPPPVPSRGVDRAYVYDMHTGIMFIVDRFGQLYRDGGRLLTVEDYEGYCRAL